MGRCWREACLGAVALLTLWRSPVLYAHPRFWAEEGKRYFASAFNEPWHESLFAAHRGYYTFFTNAATLAAARLAPLERAPAVTTWLSFLLTLVPFVLILWSEAPLLRPPAARLAAAAVVLVVAQTPEMWANSLASQFQVALVAALIGLDHPPPHGRVRSAVLLVLLFLAATSGVVACFLLPVFVWRAWRARTREVIGQAVVLGAGALLQAFLILSLPTGYLGGNRFHGTALPDVGYRLVVEDVLRPIIGPDAGGALIGVRSGTVRLAVALAGVALFAWLMNARAPCVPYLGAAAAAIAFPSHFASIDQIGGPRYAYAPSLLLMMLVIASLELEHGPPWRRRGRPRVALLLLAASLALWLPHFRDLGICFHPRWTRWPDEVARFRADPAYVIRGWPQRGGRGWLIDLDRRAAGVEP